MLTSTLARPIRPLLGLGLLFALAMPTLAQSTVLRVWVQGEILESPREDAELAKLLGEKPPKPLREWVAMIHEAAQSDDIDGMALIIETPILGLAQAEELTRAIKTFRAAGKPVNAYLDHADNLSYLLASAADDITVAEHSSIELIGLRAAVGYYKNMLDKIGVEMQMVHIGDYKSAGEPFTRTGPSEASAEQTNWLLDGLYEQFVGLIAENRGLSKKLVKDAIDDAPLNAAKAKHAGLIDFVSGFPEFRERIRSAYGSDVRVVKSLREAQQFEIDYENPFEFFTMIGEMLEETAAPREAGVGVIYVDGPIVTGKSESTFGNMAGSTTVRAALLEALEDSSIKAVVLRVSSPGGSALASDIMWKTAQKVSQRKPVIVSMGGVAASGGYYVSVPAKRIFAEATTITGSIGVIGGKPIWTELMEEKLGITTTEYHRGDAADLYSLNKPWDKDDLAKINRFLDEVYTQFKERIEAGRGERLKGDLEKMAGGRVYTGQQALELGLVDELGGLSDAIQYAGRQVGLSDPEVYTLPKPRDFAQILAQLFGEELDDVYEITIGQPAGASVLRNLLSSSKPLSRLLPLISTFAPEFSRRTWQDLTQLSIITTERVGVMAPHVPEVR